MLRSSDGPYQLEQLEMAEPGPGQVLVRVVAAGMCHTDVLPRGEVTLSPPPLITGHEGAGVVEAVGEEVEAIAVGDHVVLSYDSCGECRRCRQGQACHCDTFWVRNLLGRDLDGSSPVVDADGQPVGSRWFGQSSFASHALATARNAVVVDPSLDLEVLGPLGCGIQTGAGAVLVSLDVQPGASVVVFGAGAVGLSALMAAVVAGAGTIVAVDLHQHRLDLASELGATHTVDATVDDVVERVRAAVGGDADHSVDTTGIPTVMRDAMNVIGLGGSAAMIGAQTGDLVLDTLSVAGKTMVGVLEGGSSPQVLVPRLIGLWQDGRFPFDRLIERFGLSQINEAEQASLSGQVVKPVLIPGR